MRKETTTCLADLLQSCIDRKARLAGKLIHAHIIRHNHLSIGTFLSNRLVELYSKCSDTGAARRVFDKIRHKDIYSWNAMLGAYCKACKVEDACILFDGMPERDTISWNTLISAYARNGFEKDALHLYFRMNGEGLVPTHFTLASVLSACAAVDVECGRVCHSLAIKIDLDKNIFVGNALLLMYAKHRHTGRALQVFCDIPEPNEVSFTTIMGGLAESDRVEEALKMFTLMFSMGIRIDSVTLSSVLSICGRGVLEEYGYAYLSNGLGCNMQGQQVHCLTIKLGFERDLHLSNSLLDMYAKNGDMGSAECIFANLSEFSGVSWNIMIAGHGQKCETNKAIEYLERMQHSGFKLDEITYISAVAACAKSGDMENGRKIFDNISYPSVALWNAILSGYSQTENHGETLKLFREMQFQNIKADRTTLAVILSSCAGMGHLEGGKQVHATWHKTVFYTDVYVAGGLIDMYSKCGKTEMAKCIFDKLPALDIVCWNSMISGFSLNSLDEEAFTLFKKMQGKGILPSHFSHATLLHCCAKLPSTSLGKPVHAQIVKGGHASDLVVGSALIDMYSKFGDFTGARLFFDTMPAKSIITWNEMIHGYAQNGCGDEAVSLYKDMIGLGQKPDAITFLAVLTGCSHSGLVDTGVGIFSSMWKEHGVEPLLDHYACIIDSLGRAGRFQEAELLLNKMPYKDDPVIWEVLLRSCIVHADNFLARRAAEELLRLKPQDSALYVLLANLYTSLGRWEDASAVRELMSNKQVAKAPGYSWIEYRNKMSAFLVDQKLEMTHNESCLNTTMASESS